MRSNTALSKYLDDHLAGAKAGVKLARRTASNHAGTSAEALLQELVDEITEDREVLLHLQERLGFKRNSFKAAAGSAAEKVARLKFRHLLPRDRRLSRLLELETLSLGIAGKVALWESLKASVGTHPGGVDLNVLIERAEQQRAGVERCRLEDARTAFG